MKKKAIKYLSIVIFCLSLGSKIYSQEIEANVIVNTDQLMQEAKISVNSMANDLKQYLNNQKFTNIDWSANGPKIPVEVSIYLQGGANNRYSAKMFIASKRLLKGKSNGYSVAMKLIEENWSFEYAQGANLSFNLLRFNSFTSLIDYYMLLIIGNDMDTYGELDGTPIYEMAKQICMLGNAAGADGYKTFVSPGEFSRYALANELTDQRYQDMRKLFFSYYVDGLDQMEDNREKAIKNVEDFLNDLAKFKKERMDGPSLVLQAFFDAKYLEFIGMYKGSKNNAIFKTLEYLDPTNTTLYEDAKKQ